MVIRHGSVLQFFCCCVVCDHILLLIRPIHRSPRRVPLALFLYFQPFPTFSAFGSAWPDHVPSSLSACTLSQQVSTVSCPIRFCSLHFCTISALPFYSLCLRTANFPSFAHAEMPC
ncbi:hypothetical protein BT93_E0901 [Corymbia citriodora subsp. variegata]|nr:hypothetical protein BT93_F1167 [Corymbia citriodora subsp. variegata]KAF8028129.1 hypothetical protein BT93_E0901 [Corymbia citriodora subsp. variegata]